MREAVTPGTSLVWLETPTNPRLLVYDIRAIAAVAHDAQAPVVVDNTFATLFFQQPLELGADLVVHSVTECIAGHSDVIQGAVIARETSVFEPVKFLQNALGGVPSAFDCRLTTRGLKTLELRMERHAATAAAIAEALQSGFGGMLSFEIDGSASPGIESTRDLVADVTAGLEALPVAGAAIYQSVGR